MDSLSDSMESIRQFCQDRNWDQFHDPKELAIGLSTESNELLDLFRFQRADDMAKMLEDPASRERMSQELADILFFLLRFAQLHRFDLLDALRTKMRLNERKYPVDKAYGSNAKLRLDE